MSASPKSGDVQGGPEAEAGQAADVPAAPVVLAAHDQGEDDRLPDRRLMSLLCLVGALEGADGVLLPCVFYALQLDLGLTLNELALMGLVQGLAGNAAAPVWGALADRGTMRRKTLIVGGCVAQGCITVALAAVDRLVPMILLRALNGVMLASLRPIATAVLADVTGEKRRGEVFGRMGFMMNLGCMGGSFIGTNLATKVFGGMQGWRVAFVLVGSASVILGLLSGLFMVEPPRSSPVAAQREGMWTEVRKLGRYFRIPTFCVVISQGFFAVMAWIAICGYNNLFFQVAGLTPLQTSLISILGTVSGSVGVLLGGMVGDRLTRCSRFHGRPLTAQISVGAGVPIAALMFAVAPPEGGAFFFYLALSVLMGLLATWCYFAVNAPILAEIVEADSRTSIMAWEGALSSSFSTIFGNALVGFFAQNVFGYSLDRARRASPAENAKNIKALGKALMAVSVFPFILCFLCYSLLHYTYPRDMRRLEQDRARRTEEQQALSKLEEPDEVDNPDSGNRDSGSPASALKAALQDTLEPVAVQVAPTPDE